MRDRARENDNKKPSLIKTRFSRMPNNEMKEVEMKDIAQVTKQNAFKKSGRVFVREEEETEVKKRLRKGEGVEDEQGQEEDEEEPGQISFNKGCTTTITRNIFF